MLVYPMQPLPIVVLAGKCSERRGEGDNPPLGTGFPWSIGPVCTDWCYDSGEANQRCVQTLRGADTTTERIGDPAATYPSGASHGGF
jgi:hypothetical protein